LGAVSVIARTVVDRTVADKSRLDVGWSATVRGVWEAVRRHWPAIVSWPLAAGCGLVALIRVFGLDQGFPLVQAMSFTPYVALGSIFAAAVAGLSRQWWALGVAGGAAVALLVCVMPRGVSAGDPSHDGAPITVMSLNLRIGGADARSIVDLVREAQVDVLALQEYTPDAEHALTEAGLADLLPYGESHPSLGASGSAVFSRVPLTDHGSRVASPDGFFQAYATLEQAGTSVVIESVHPVPPLTAEHTRRWAAGLRNQVRADAPGPPRILAGDFNATLDHSALRELLDTGYRDAAAEAGEGFTPTWPFYGRRSLITPRIALDHVLVPPGIGVRDFRVVTIPRTDHRAIIAMLSV
jgi:endonuclease/exonuclease/phosphatase family metal-dependent hydrolase